MLVIENYMILRYTQNAYGLDGALYQYYKAGYKKGLSKAFNFQPNQPMKATLSYLISFIIPTWPP